MKHLSRKFLLAAVSLAVASVALFVGKLAGGEFVAALGVILGLYGGANVAAAKGTAKADQPSI